MTVKYAIYNGFNAQLLENSALVSSQMAAAHFKHGMY